MHSECTFNSDLCMHTDLCAHARMLVGVGVHSNAHPVSQVDHVGNYLEIA